MDTLHLYFDRHLNGYCAQLPGPGGTFEADTSFTLGIINRGGFAEKDESPWRFKWIVNEDGEWMEVCTAAAYSARLKDIEDHEGEAIAKFWDLQQDVLRVARPDELRLFQRYERKFLAMAELGLSIPHIFGEQFVNPRPQMSLAADMELTRLRNEAFDLAEGDAERHAVWVSKGNRGGDL